MQKARSTIDSMAQKNAPGLLDAIADVWADRVKTYWTGMYAINPESINRTAANSEGVLTSGIFAYSDKGRIIVACRQITFRNKVFEAISFVCKEFDYCFAGKSHVIVEFATNPSAAARSKFESWTPPATGAISNDAIGAIKLVHLTIALDRSGDVGGPIDALEMWGDGTIHWIQRKPNCPETQY